MLDAKKKNKIKFFSKTVGKKKLNILFKKKKRNRERELGKKNKKIKNKNK